jgi:pimeloyl-ACP methyl ester carboxylesterase
MDILASPMAPRTRAFDHMGHRLVFDEYGAGDKPIVLLPGLLLSRKMHEPLAEQLAAGGHRVLCLDLLAHGESDRPPEMIHYSMTLFAEQVIALLDHLEIQQAVIGGTSLGANVTLEAAALAPERTKAMLVEMPVLDNALVACAVAFTPLLLGLTFGAPVARLLARGARAVPRGSWRLADMVLDSVSQDPKPSASVLQGLFFGRIAPPSSERKLLGMKALVIGHPRDPVHPFNDSDQLVRELPNARLVEANSILELRLTPERLTAEILAFADECWEPESPRAREPGRRRAAASSSRRGGTPRRPSA